MAFPDPRILKSVTKRYVLKIHDLEGEDLAPNGDRYVVEMIETDENIEYGKLLVMTQAVDKNGKPDPMADPTMENRGVLPAVVVSKGNGHLLGLPDWALPPNEVSIQHMPNHMAVQRVSADVPMFYDVGDVVFIDINAKGRALKIFGKDYRIVNQIDVLASCAKLKLKKTKDGWEPV